MASPSLELYSATIQRLKADGAVAALVGARIYDEIRPNPVYPYLNFANFDVHQDDVTCQTGYDIYIDIDGWTNTSGNVQAWQLAHAVVKALHDWTPTLATNDCITYEHTQTRIFKDLDDAVTHCVMTFRVAVTEK